MPFKHCVCVGAFFVDCSILLDCMAWSWHFTSETCQHKTCQLYQADVRQRLCRKYRLGLSTPCVLVCSGKFWWRSWNEKDSCALTRRTDCETNVWTCVTANLRLLNCRKNWPGWRLTCSLVKMTGCLLSCTCILISVWQHCTYCLLMFLMGRFPVENL